MAYASMFGALTAVGAYIMIPLPPVPITMQTLFVSLEHCWADISGPTGSPYPLRSGKASRVSGRRNNHEARYIAFDEPTASLDPVGRRRILETMRQLHRSGISIIHITHDVNDIADADRLLVMDKGKIIQDGIPREIFSKMAGGTGYSLRR